MKKDKFLEKIDERIRELSEVFITLSDKFYDKVYGIVEEKEFKKKRYIKFLDNLKREIDRLQYLKSKTEKEKGLSIIFKDYSENQLSLGYGLPDGKSISQKGLNQCKSCAKCNCASCIENCEFSSCQGCRENGGSNVVYCDHETECLVSFSNYTFDILDNNTNRNFKANAICSVEFESYENRYLNFTDYRGDKIIVKWTPGISEDNYEEIEDANTFDKVVEVIQNNLE